MDERKAFTGFWITLLRLEETPKVSLSNLMNLDLIM